MGDLLQVIEEIEAEFNASPCKTRLDKIRRLGDVLPTDGALDKDLLIPGSREEEKAVLRETAARSILHWAADTGIRVVEDGKACWRTPLGNGQWANMPYTRTMAKDAKTPGFCVVTETAMLQPLPDEERAVWGGYEGRSSGVPPSSFAYCANGSRGRIRVCPRKSRGAHLGG